MKAAVLSRWNGAGEVTPSALRIARVNCSPSRRSLFDGNRSSGAYTSIIGIDVNPSARGVLNHFRHVLRMREKQDVTRGDLGGLRIRALGVEALEIRIDRPIIRSDDIP